jgi:predicted nucleic acid-binding protein
LALIENEEGAERVESLIRDEVTLVPFLSILELHYITLQERGQAEADRRYALLKQLPCKILWHLDEPLVLTASRFKAGHKISLADAMISAFAHRHGAVLVHKDPEYEALAEEELELEALPYKAGRKGIPAG